MVIQNKNPPGTTDDQHANTRTLQNSRLILGTNHARNKEEGKQEMSSKKKEHTADTEL